MPEISRQQKQYLARQKKEKNIILAARTLLFVLFMGLWEISSDLGWIDSFIFSSPSLIAETFLSMCRDQSLFSRDTGRNSCQFLFCCDPGCRNRSTSLVLPTDRTDPGAMSGGTEQSPEICSGPSSDRMAWCQRTYHRSRRHVCSHLRLRYQSVLRFLPGRSGKTKTD